MPGAPWARWAAALPKFGTSLLGVTVTRGFDGWMVQHRRLILITHDTWSG